MKLDVAHITLVVAGPPRYGDDERWLDFRERVLRINLTGAMLCGQSAARTMIDGGKGGGRIINIASISGQRGGSERAAYGASKAGLINLTAVMAIELAPHNIVVTPLPRSDRGRPFDHVRSGQSRPAFSRMAIKRAVQPAEIAAAALFLAERENAMITGHVLNVDGGFNVTGILYDQ